MPLFELTLEIRPPSDRPKDPAVPWRSLVGVLDPWLHQGTAVILGQTGFLNAFTVTLGPNHFAVEPGDAFAQRFPGGPA